MEKRSKLAKQRNSFVIQAVSWLVFSQHTNLEEAFDTKHITFDIEKLGQCNGYITAVKNCIQDLIDYITDDDLRKNTDLSIKKFFKELEKRHIHFEESEDI